MRKLLFAVLSMVTLTGLSALQIPKLDRMYIDEKEMSADFDSFHLHIGENIWLNTNTVHRDSTGLFSYECDIIKSDPSLEYEKKWKCPYCFNYWPIGKACQNKDCPSKYKDSK